MGKKRIAWSLLLFLLGSWLETVPATAGEVAPDVRETRSLSAVVGQFRKRMGIHDRVSVSLVEANPRLVSVGRSKGHPTDFIVEFDRQFLATLTPDELRAAVAHELGHVWIFTHHPYLQTEPLANEKALEVVSRQSLEDVYAKVWKHGGQQGTLEEFLEKVE